MEHIIKPNSTIENKMKTECPYKDYLFGEKYIRYGGYNPETFSLTETLNFFAKRYVIPLSKEVDISNIKLCDCACGYGWFTLAFLLMGGGSNVSEPVVCMDLDSTRGEIINDFAKIYGLNNKIKFIAGDLSALPFENKKFDVFVSIETLEHVPQKLRNKALREISRVSEYQLITTPNKLWPIDYHDRQMPFKHWFDGRFLNQFQVIKHLNAELLTNVYCFNSWEELESIYPLYWPYPGQLKNLSKFSTLPFKLLSYFSEKGVQYVMPQIQGIYRNATKK